MKKRPVKRIKQYLGFGKKRRTEELIEKIISRLAKKGNLNVLIEILKIKKKSIQIKILSILLEQDQSGIESICDLPDEIADFLQLSPEIEEKLWNKFSANITTEELLCLIRFRNIFKQKAIALAIKIIKRSRIRGSYLRELLKEIIICGDEEQRRFALEEIKKIRLSYSDLQEIINKRPEIEELRILRRTIQKIEDREFKRLERLKKIIEKI